MRYWKLRAAALAAIGLGVGVLTGFTGVGPGFLIAPTLASLFGMVGARSQSASLVMMLAAAAVGALVYAFAGYADRLLDGLTALGAIIGALAGTRLTGGRAQVLLRKAAAIGLVAAGVQILLASAHASAASGPCLGPGEGFLAGTVAGLVGGAAGIGSGALLIPILTILFSASQKLAQAVALAVVIPASLPLFLIHYARRSIDRYTGPPLAAGSALGGYIGATIAVQTSPTLLAAIFGILLIIFAAVIFARE